MPILGYSVCVHTVASSQKEAEFRFKQARYSIEDGALRVISTELPELDLMVFSPGVWKAAWIVDPATGKPLGLDDPVFLDPPQPLDKAAAPLATGSRPDDRAERSRRVQAALAEIPYESLEAFSLIVGEKPDEVEFLLSQALNDNLIDPDQVAIESVQRELDLALPAILAARPKRLQDILNTLRHSEPPQACDYVQLRVWIKRNPGKR